MKNEGRLESIAIIEKPTTLYVWGKNEHGQLGLGEKQIGGIFPVPQRVDMNQQVMKVSCGDKHSTFLTQGKQLYIMGSNEHGQLGTYGSQGR